MGVGQRVQSEACSRVAERKLVHVRDSMVAGDSRLHRLPRWVLRKLIISSIGQSTGCTGRDEQHGG